MGNFSGLLQGLMDQMQAAKAEERGRLQGENRDEGFDSLFGNSLSGLRANALAPDFLKGAAGAGGGLGEFFAQAFQGINDPRQLNMNLGALGQEVSGRARRARSVGKFKGSPIGEALAGAIQTGGDAVAQQTRLQDQQRRFQQGLGLAQGFTGAVTNPLLNLLGLSIGDEQSRAALAQQQSQFQASQPSGFDKFLGTVGPILGAAAMFCWVARAVLQDDRWLAAREFMLNEAPDYVRRMYADHGEELAERVATNPDLRVELTPVFEEFARRGAKYVGG